MPTTPRNSSLGGGSRRGPIKAHIPYRGDNPEVGKKTGIAVQHVARQSDGFEPFDQVLQQADGRTPPRPKSKKKSMTAAAHQDEDDYGSDNGWEESMQLDSPIHHLIDTQPAFSPAKSRRSSFRPVARTSDIDYDKIPSPRPNTSSHKSARNGIAGPSSTSKYMRNPQPDSGSPNSGDQDNGMGPDPFDDYAPQENRSPGEVSPRRKSFGVIEQEADEDEDGQEEEELPQETPSKRDKGKRKAALYEEPDQDVEEEIAEQLDNVGLGMDSDDDQKEPQPPVKKPKTDVKNQKGQTQSKKKKENIAPRQGVRRSQREHYRPLEYWRGEKLVYGRTAHSGPILVPQIKEIIRIPKEASVPLGTTKRKRGSTRARSQSKAIDAVEPVIPPALPVVDPEEGWDDNTEAKCTVIHFTSKEEVDRRIAWTAKMVNPRESANSSWMFDKIFGDDDFIAAGQLIIPPKGRKPSKAAKDNTYVFYVIEGAVNFKIHETSMILATGGMFMVPRGNTYFIENICNRDARLFFTQARKVAMSKEELAARAEVAAELQQRRKSAVRSPSAGAQSTA